MKNGSSTIEWVSPEQAELYESVVRFARTLPDDVRDRERDEIFSRQSWDRCGAFGIQGLPASGSYGGGEADVVTTMLALEALGYGCTDAGLVFSINAHMWTSVVPLSLFGNEQQKQRWLPGLCSGQLIGCHAITEPDAGSDVFSLTHIGEAGRRRLCAGRSEDVHHERPDRRPHVGVRPHHRRASARTVSRRSSSRRVQTGLTLGRPLDKMGLRTSPMSEVIVDDCFVSDAAMLGQARTRRRDLHGLHAMGTCVHHGQPGGPDAPDDGTVHRLRTAAQAVREGDRQVRVGGRQDRRHEDRGGRLARPRPSRWLVDGPGE